MQQRRLDGGVPVPLHPTHRRGTLVAYDLCEYLVELGLAGQQFVHDEAQRVHVGTPVDSPPVEQLGGHVTRRAKHHGRLTADTGGYPEVHYRRPETVTDDDVARLDVAVNDPRRVNRVQRTGQTPQYLQGGLVLRRTVRLGYDRRQGVALYELHDDEEPLGVLDQVVYGNDTRLLGAEFGEDLGFLAEAIHELGVVGEMGRYLLDRHVPVQKRVVGLVHDRLPAHGGPLHDLVLANLGSGWQSYRFGALGVLRH